MPEPVLSRRRFLAGAAVATGVVATGGVYWYLNGGSAPNALTLGSNASDTIPRQAMQAVVDAFTARTGISVRVNTSDPNSFQDRIATYLPAETQMYVPKVEATVMRREGVELAALATAKN